MEHILDFGVQIDEDGEPYPYMENMETMIPSDHAPLFFLISKRKELDSLCSDLKEYVKTGIGNPKTMVDKLSAMHPYFSTFRWSAAAYINHSIAQEINDSDLSENEKQTQFEQLMATTIPDSSTKLEDWIHGHSLETLYNAVYDAGLYVALVLNDSNPELASISTAKRNSLYNMVALETEMTGNAAMLNLNVRYVPAMSEYLDTFRAVLEFDDDFTNLYSKMVNDVQGLMDGEDIIPDAMLKMLEKAKNSKETSAQIIYTIDTLEDLIHLELYFMQKNGIRVKKCKTCGKWFAVLHDDQIYCDYSIPGSLSHYQTYLENKRRENIRMIYRRVYKAKHELYRRNVITDDELHTWAKWATKEKEMAINNGNTAEEYHKELKNQKTNHTIK